MCGKWYSTEEWLAKAEERHGDWYEYPNFTYESSRQLIDIRCKNCRSEFSKQANEHLRTRPRGSGCPLKCRDSKIHRIKDDEFLSVEYDHELNGPVKYFSAMVDPFWLPSKTTQSLWWICVDCNHSWNAIRGGGQGCPSCAGKEVNNFDGRNSAAAIYPSVVNNWSEKNSLSPYEVNFGSGKYFLFTCIQNECGRVHRSRLNNKVRAWYCSYCRNDSIGRGMPGTIVWESYPKLEGFLSDKRDKKTQTSASGEVLEWRCEECSEVHHNTIRNQVNRNKPEFCGPCAFRWVATNRKQRTIEFEEFKQRADERHEGGYEYDPESYTKASDKVRMKHLVCGIWKGRTGTSHMQGSGCSCGPIRQTQTKLFKIVKQLLPGNNPEMDIKHPLLRISNKRWLDFDIWVPELSLALEYQGKQHYEPIDYFGGEDAFERRTENDALKKKIASENGIKLIEVHFSWDKNVDSIKRLLIENGISLSPEPLNSHKFGKK